MPIHTLQSSWILETANTGYSFGVNAGGMLVHTYWGACLPRKEDYPTPQLAREWLPSMARTPGARRIPGLCRNKYTEPCFKATFAKPGCATQFGFMSTQK